MSFACTCPAGRVPYGSNPQCFIPGNVFGAPAMPCNEAYGSTSLQPITPAAPLNPATTTAPSTAGSTAAQTTTNAASNNAAAAGAAALQQLNQAAGASNAAAAANINNVAATSDGGQTTSLQDAQNVNQLGANQAATVGAVYCAEGANLNLTDPVSAGTAYSSCNQYFSAANQMKGNAQLQSDPNVLASPSAQNTLASFSKNFGLTDESYLSQMLKSGGGSDVLGDMITDKVGVDKFQAALAAAEDAKPTQEELNKYAVNFGSSKQLVATAKPSLKENLRKALQAKLDRQPASDDRSENRDKLAESEDTKLKGLEPLDKVFAPQEQSPQEEWTLFDVVHGKYTEVRRRWRN